YDVTKYLLNSFGGAGGQHACLVADALGMEAVLMHPMSGLLSAYGIGLARVSASRQQGFVQVLSAANLAAIEAQVDQLKQAVAVDLSGQGIGEHDTIVTLHLRYEGTDTALHVAWGSDIVAARAAFETTHKAQFGFSSPERDVIVEAVEVEGRELSSEPARKRAAAPRRFTPAPSQSQPLFSGGQWHDAAVYLREDLAPGAHMAGPALIIEANQTIVVEPGWQAELTGADQIIMTRAVPAVRAAAAGAEAADPILLEVFNNLFMNIAEQMGVALQNTAQSVNIKERLDFSCAVFDASGALVANAPHMPVHLGSMDRSVETIIRLNAGNVHPGDAFALNAPYNGGTHLPDITVVSPVFDPEGQEILFWTASRGHHADVGGTAPGSMTPLATNVDEEGVLIDNFQMVRAGVFREDALYKVLTEHKYPCRNPAMNIADLKAQLAANERGAAELRVMVDSFTLPVVQAYMTHVQDNAAEEVARLIGRLDDCACSYETDTGQVIKVAIRVDRENRKAVVDFTGTSPAIANNFNAPEPVARAAVLYAFRVMVEAPIPMNAGCLRPIEIIIPEGCMLRPAYPRAVVAGNVETSQHVTNALFQALGALANGQGTMNNLTFGNETHQYYETICSGSPAGQMNDGTGFAGTAGVHTHMTNSRLTDPEVLEMRFPVLVERFALRPGSGGGGAFAGGDGTERVLRFLEDMDCSILSSHRARPPMGINGGQTGEVGQTRLRRLDGSIEVLPACAQVRLKAGEIVELRTPTPGGYGAKDTD
ncbi:MAG: hydantoinase B/oxoprolinase family protein, partial [Rhodobacteraceae bacterium]|nr:hydantoinase B/oxoprolinase family protein [Paracoccaceae bacterium]